MNTAFKLDLDAIERAARGATAGDWFPVHDVILVDAPGRGETDFPAIASCVGEPNAAANAAHISAADPATVLLMCKAIRAAQEAMALYHDGPLPASIRALREALTPFDAQPEASTTGSGGQQYE